MKLIKIILITVVLMLATKGYAQSVTVIVNNSVNISSIDKSELQKIYMGKVELWGNNIRVIPCYIRPDKNESGNLFFEKVLEMDLDKFNKAWLKKVFAGYGTKPNEFTDDNNLIEYVSKTNGAIGFISSSNKVKASSCKVIKTEGIE